MTIRAVWRGKVLAESEDTVRLEGNHYFPPESLKREFFADSSTTSVCPWKGRASYYDVVVEGEVNRAAAWYYPDPSAAAANIKGRVAFWHGVKVETGGGSPAAERSGPLARLRVLLGSGR